MAGCADDAAALAVVAVLVAAVALAVVVVAIAIVAVAVVELMENLINNHENEAIGIATSGREMGGEGAPAPGFQFTFRKTADSVGYVKPETHSYSILNMRLDIRQLDPGPVPAQRN